MKKIILIIFVLSFSYVLANPISKCIKKYPTDVQKVYVMSYSVLKNNKYNVLEIQSESGYILFSAKGREFLLETTEDNGNSLIKITPVDLNYTDLTIQENLFKSLDEEILKVK